MAAASGSEAFQILEMEYEESFDEKNETHEGHALFEQLIEQHQVE